MTEYIVFSPFIYAIVSCLIGKKNDRAGDVFAAAAALLELGAAALAFLPYGSHQILPGVLTGGLGFRTDGFRTVYALITAFMWAGTSLFAIEYFARERRCMMRYRFFLLATLGATEGVMLSADLMTAFIFFEILSFTSFTWVIHEETPGAIKAGYTYLFIAVIGGLVLLAGLLMLRSAVGTLVFDELRTAAARASADGKGGTLLAAAICILLGFGAKAGMFPLHVWLPKAHPVAPSPASALLSGILTKVGVYGILMISASAMAGSRPFGLIVLAAGLVTMLLGAVLALFSIDLKRTLACSSMSQIGFILTGIAMMILSGDESSSYLASCGLSLHMVNHSLIKLVLFMAAGAVVMNLEKLNLNDIRGWGRNKVPLMIAFALGALGISGVPLFSGYVSKTLLHESIVHGAEHIPSLSALLFASEWVFLISGGLTFAYMLKLFICIFVEKNSDPELQKKYDGSRKCMNPLSSAVVLACAALMAVLGQLSASGPLAALMTGRDEIMNFSLFSFENLRGAAISLAIGAAVYLIFVRRIMLRAGSYRDLWPAWLDLEDGVYRPLLTGYLPMIFGSIAAVFGENKVLRVVCRQVLSLAGGFASLLGEDRIVLPLCRSLLLVFQAICRFFELLPEYLVVFFRRTILREKKVRGGSVSRPGLFRVMATELSETSREISSNFTFALMMTCIGIVVILVIVVF